MQLPYNINCKKTKQKHTHEIEKYNYHYTTYTQYLDSSLWIF